jgi:phage shock protein A
MLKSIAIGLGGLVVAAGLILGPMTVVNHFRAAREVVREELGQMSPDVQEAARIRVLLRDMDKKILDYQEKVAEVGERGTSADTTTSRIEKELESEKAVLTRAKGLLDQGLDRYEIGGKAYTRDEVCADAKARLQHSEQLANRAEFQRRIAEQLRVAEREGRENLLKAQQAKREREAELKDLETRLANAGLLRQVNELTGDLDENPLGPQTDLGQAFAEFRRRVRVAESQTEYLATEAKGGMLVDWNGTGSANKEVSHAIGQFLAGQPKQ